MLALFAAAQIVAAPPAPPAPPVIYPTFTMRPGYRASGQGERYTVDVEVRGGGAVLWSGPLRVGGSYGATTIRRDQSEPGDASCPSSDYASPIATSFTLTLSPRGSNGSLSVTVRWSRPGDQPCGPGPNSRTVELTQVVALDQGGNVTVNGDGGVSVRLRRR